MNDTAIAIAVALLSFSMPVTAAIVGRSRKIPSGGYTIRELAGMEAKIDTLVADMRGVKVELKEIRDIVSP